MENNVVLSMHDISKTFPGVKALQHVDFTLRKGEIHALMGENGAGKSTLIKVLTGVHSFESGEILMAGSDGAIINRSPQEAQEHGISTVYQEVNLCPNLTVAENLFIGREPKKLGMIDWHTMNKKSTALLKSLSIDARATDKLEECSIAKQQMIAIARAVDMKCQVLILDEPTSSLDDEEVEKLFVLMRKLKDQGVGIIFVTHFLEQVYEVCDRITVLRNGHLVGEYPVKELPRVELVAKMMGKNFDDLADIKGDHKKLEQYIPVVEAEQVGRKGSIRPFDFTVNKGEVVGLTGLLGSGRSELVRAIYGADKPDGGTIKVNGKEVKIKSPLDAMKLGMAYLPEDRKKDGILADLSVRENMIIALQAKKGMFHPMSRKEMEEAAYVDGCGMLETFVKIMLPDAKPILTSCFLFAFVWQWTDSFYSKMFLGNIKLLSIQLAQIGEKLGNYLMYTLHRATGASVGYTQCIVSTGTLMVILPILILYLFAQKGFVESLSSTGIKM